MTRYGINRLLSDRDKFMHQGADHARELLDSVQCDADQPQYMTLHGIRRVLGYEMRRFRELGWTVPYDKA